MFPDGRRGALLIRDRTDGKGLFLAGPGSAAHHYTPKRRFVLRCARTRVTLLAGAAGAWPVAGASSSALKRRYIDMPRHCERSESNPAFAGDFWIGSSLCCAQ
jgi:hypothetical protein